jgi:hypothetical protein
LPGFAFLHLHATASARAGLYVQGMAARWRILIRVFHHVQAVGDDHPPVIARNRLVTLA